MTRDVVRAAMLSDQPWARLDELVRSGLAAGRSVRQVGDELRTLQADLEDTPGLSEDGGDALLDTLESLHQMGPRKYWYSDPPVPATVPVTAVAAVTRKKNKRVPKAAKPEPELLDPVVAAEKAAELSKRIARVLKHLETTKRGVLPGTPHRKSAQPSTQLSGRVEATCRVIFPAGELRGVQLLGGRAIRLPKKGFYVIPHSDIATLTSANISFAFVGATDDD